MTRKSTPKYEVVHEFLLLVMKTNISKTEANSFCRTLNNGRKDFYVRKVKSLNTASEK